MNAQDILDKRVRAYLQTLPSAISGEHGHNTTFHVAAILVWGFALPEDQALYFFMEYNARCEPPWPERDLRRKLQQADNHPGHQHPRGYLLGDQAVPLSSDRWPPLPLPPSPPKPAYKPEALAGVAGKVSDEITAEYLEARSRFTCWNRSPAGVLHKLFRPGERVVVFDVFESQGCEVWTHPGIAGDFSSLDYLQAGQQFGAWFMANPVDGEYRFLDRLKTEYNPAGRSRRCEECVTAWRYLVIESDHAPTDLWLRALVRLPLRISAIYMSGGKSIHALVRIDASSKSEWDTTVRGEMSRILIPLGACAGALTAVRLTRLPNCRREETKQLQSLLYLCDEPDAVPICEKQPREAPEAVWMRWSQSLIYWSSDDSINPDTKADARACADGLKASAHRPGVSERIAELEALYVP